ncbi:hypothetical protein Hypma_004865 [Hypsizygus marmoreus]|uniref:Uncharacterized protein n=1 Tax=Hypsizygus marmoreus TaxID=39966 RepID=A0A369J431_HYPMA|nr:hypothetical protein Hypma_004865 [Hypsizygus marmoreus]
MAILAKRYTPTGIATVSSSLINSSLSTAERRAGARAILRSGQHNTDHFETRTPGGLHPAYVDLHGRGDNAPEERREIKNVLKDSLGDVFDAITTLDRLDGGLSLLIRCPGHQGPTSLNIDNAQNTTLDVYASPRELVEGGQALSKSIALIIQSFGTNIALPFLGRFVQRCKAENVNVPLAPRPGKQLKIEGPSHLPDAESDGGIHLRCRCHSGSAVALAQQMSLVQQISKRIQDEDTVRPPPPSEPPSDKKGNKLVPRKSAADGFEGAIISIGVRTDGVLDRFGLADAVIPRLRVITQTVRSSRWEHTLRNGDLALSYEQAANLSRAMERDLGVTSEASGAQMISCSLITQVALAAIVVLVVAVFIFPG